MLTQLLTVASRNHQQSKIVALTRTQQYLTKQLSFFSIHEKPRSLFKNKYNNQMARSPLCHHHGKIVCLANSVIRMRFMRNEKGCVGGITILQKKKSFDVQFKYKVSMQGLYTRFQYRKIKKAAWEASQYPRKRNVSTFN